MTATKQKYNIQHNILRVRRTQMTSSVLDAARKAETTIYFNFCCCCNNFVCKILQNTESIFLLRKFQLLLKRQISGRRLSKTSEWKKNAVCVCGARENQRLQRFSFLNTVWFLLFIYIWFASVCNFHSVHQSMLLVMKRMMMLKFITQSKNDLIRLLISFELKRANK